MSRIPSFAQIIFSTFVVSFSSVSSEVIYAHAFDGDGTNSLNGVSTTTGGGTWVANRITDDDGTMNNGEGSAVLPFTPLVDEIYTLSMDLTHGGTNDWIGLGFCRDALSSVGGDSSAQRFSNNSEGIAWMIYRNNTTDADDIQIFGGLRTGNPIADTGVWSAGTHVLTVILDTAGDGTRFTADFLIDGSSVSGGAQTIVRNIDDINYVGFTSADDTSGDSTVVDNFFFSDSQAADTTDPVLTSLSPVDDSSEVPTFSDLVVTFDEAVMAGGGSVTINNLTDGSSSSIPIGDGQISIIGTTLTVSPTEGLLGLKDYAVQIDAGAVQDISGNTFSGITDDTTWSFTTDVQTSADDIDGDDLSDQWEIENFGSLAYDGADDSDNDGLNNEAEESANTDPHDPLDYPGAPVDLAKPNGMMVDLLSFPERTTIPDRLPEFTWYFNPLKRGGSQSSYQIIVSNSAANSGNEIGDAWDSGVVSSSDSVDVELGGNALTRGSTYFWRVRTWEDDSGSPSSWSKIQKFHIEATNPPSGARSIHDSSSNEWSGRYQPGFDTIVSPVQIVDKGSGNYFIDFGKDAFGYLSLDLDGNFSGQTLEVRMGEKANGNSVDTSPGATIRYKSTSVALGDGTNTYEVKAAVFAGANGTVPLPWAGDFMPFRYVELLNCPAAVTVDDIRQHFLHTPFDENAASFSSSDATLDAVWDLCQYSMKATSFAGVYVDGDRERRPYEADAYINQLSHYGVDRAYAIGRHSYEYLLSNPTWPTEWRLHFAPMAWADFMATGNKDALVANYADLKSQLFLNWIRSADGLFESQLTGTPRDIVDWPVAERDGYVRTEINTVVNAFHYQALRLMAQIATEVGETVDAADFTTKADALEASFNSVFWNGSLYQDGETTSHVSAHANFFPMSLGLVPADRTAAVMNYLTTRRMPCSVYGAQYLLEALFEGGEADHAIGLMADNDPNYKRHFWNMLVEGSTITMETWDNDFKANTDWNHAWGAAPGNIVPRYVLGLKPLEAGYGQVEIKPQLGTGSATEGLTSVSGAIPTIRGQVEMEIENSTTSFMMGMKVPGNMTAKVSIPTKGYPNATILYDGMVVTVPEVEGRLVLENVPSGTHAIWLSDTSTPDEATLKENWKMAMFGAEATSPMFSGDGLDPDGDGQTTLDEFYANTDPLDFSDQLSVESFLLDDTRGTFEMTVPGKPGRRYLLQRTVELDPANWSEVDSFTSSTTGNIILIDDSPTGSSQAFYRIGAELPW